MTGTIALLAAIAFIGVALYRLSPSAPPRVRDAQLAFALIAGLCGILFFRSAGDSRWLVGGVLMFGAAVPGFLAGNRRTLATIALICGLCGVALYAVATTRPMASRVVSVG